MKTLILATILAAGSLSAFGGPRGFHYSSHSTWSHGQYRPSSYHHHHSYWRPSVSFYYGGPWYSPSYYPVYAYSSPAYNYSYSYPAYSGYTYSSAPYTYSRPNYAVSGTLLGALTGGLIGAADHHGWEGAGIGAAAGLVLGGLAESSARYQERSYAPGPAAAPVVSYPSPAPIANAPTVNTAPTVPNAPGAAPASRPASSSSMSEANRLFGR